MDYYSGADDMHGGHLSPPIPSVFNPTPGQQHDPHSLPSVKSGNSVSSGVEFQGEEGNCEPAFDEPLQPRPSTELELMYDPVLNAYYHPESGKHFVLNRD
jgi:hypothetical protein